MVQFQSFLAFLVGIFGAFCLDVRTFANSWVFHRTTKSKTLAGEQKATEV